MWDLLQPECVVHTLLLIVVEHRDDFTWCCIQSHPAVAVSVTQQAADPWLTAEALDGSFTCLKADGNGAFKLGLQARERQCFADRKAVWSTCRESMQICWTWQQHPAAAGNATGSVTVCHFWRVWARVEANRRRRWCFLKSRMNCTGVRSCVRTFVWSMESSSRRFYGISLSQESILIHTSFQWFLPFKTLWLHITKCSRPSWT